MPIALAVSMATGNDSAMQLDDIDDEIAAKVFRAQIGLARELDLGLRIGLAPAVVGGTGYAHDRGA